MRMLSTLLNVDSEKGVRQAYAITTRTDPKYKTQGLAAEPSCPRPGHSLYRNLHDSGEALHACVPYSRRITEGRCEHGCCC